MILPNPAFRLSESCPRGPRELANQKCWLGQFAQDAKSDWAGQPEDFAGGLHYWLLGRGKGPAPSALQGCRCTFVKYQLTPGLAQRGCLFSYCFLLKSKVTRSLSTLAQKFTDENRVDDL